jgi:hypothetical protein
MEKKEDQNPSIRPVSSETDSKTQPKAEKVWRRWGRGAKKDATGAKDATDPTEEEKAKEPNMDGSTVMNFFVSNYTP